MVEVAESVGKLATENSLKELAQALSDKCAGLTRSLDWQPLLDRVLVVALPEPDWKAHRSGLIIASKESEQWFYLVLAVGPGIRKDSGVVQPIDLAIGSIVIGGHFLGHPITIDGQEFRLVKAADLLAVYDPSEGSDAAEAREDALYSALGTTDEEAQPDDEEDWGVGGLEPQS